MTAQPTDSAWHSHVIGRHQLAAFFALSFLWSWASFYLVARPLSLTGTRTAQVVFAWGPLVGAAVVTKASGGDLREWAGQITNVDVRPWWFLLALLVPLLLTDGGRLLVWLAGAPVVVDVSPVEFLTQFLVTLFVAGSLEEFGWRGFAQPRMQERWSALTAAVVIGVVWALWHVPMVYRGAGAGYDTGALAGFVIGLPMFSIAMAWLYNSTRGGLAFVMLFHAMINAPSPLRIADDAPAWATTVGELGSLAVLFGIPAVLVVVNGWAYLADDRPDPPISGLSDTNGR